jgi:PAS domain S-box-containing protein
MENLSTLFRRIAFSAILFAILLNLCILSIWHFELDHWIDYFPSKQIANPVTSLCFMLAFFCIILIQENKKPFQLLAQAIGFLILSIGLVTFLSTILPFESTLDKWLYADTLLKYGSNGMPNYMAPNTAICFFLAGTALFFTKGGFAGNNNVPDILSLIAAILAFVSIIGYIYEANEFYHVHLLYVPMSFPTALCFFLLSLTILMLRGKNGYFRLFTSPYAGSRLARYIVPVAIVIPILLGGLRLWGESVGLYSTQFGVALLITTIIILFISAIIPSCIYINRVNKKLAIEINERSRLNRQVAAFNQELENKVEQKRITLIKNERLFRSMIEHSVDVVIITGINGKVKYISPSVAKVLGLEPAEVINSSGLDIIHPDYQSIIREAHKNLEISPDEIKHFTIQVRNKDGHYLWIDGSMVNLLHDDSVKGVVTNFHDITDFVTAEEEKRKLENHLWEEKISNQRKSLEAMIQGEEKQKKAIGMELHDNINQILASTSLYLDLALTRPTMSEEMIRKSKQQIITAINEIRSLSKELVPYHFEQVNIKESIVDFLENLKQTKGIQYELKISEEALYRISKEQQVSIFRILQEQLNNIMKYAKASCIEIIIAKSENIIYFQTKDDGQGFNLNEKRAGIGLNNIKNRVDLLNGNLQIETAPGKGCAMKISFPIVDEELMKAV